MSKSQIRDLMRRRNRALDIRVRHRVAKEIFREVELSPQFISANCIAIYSSLPDELPTSHLIERWHATGRRILLPRVVSSTEMEFIQYSPDSLVLGEFGTLEPSLGEAVDPSAIDLMIVPALAFGRAGERLGRGAGYYDRYLAREGFRAYTIGIGFPHQLLETLPCEPHDRALDRVICEAGCSIPSIILSTLEYAGVDARQLGCGVDSLLERGLTWVLLRYSLRIDRIPEGKIEIETWISSCNRISSNRNFQLLDSDGEPLGEAITTWCLMDMEARKAVNLESSEINYSQHIKEREYTIAHNRRLPEIDPEGEIEQRSHLATMYDLDFNRHVNTIRYIEMMLEMEPLELRTKIAPVRVEFHFVNESRLDDTLTIKRQEQPSATGRRSLYEITREDGSPSVRGLFEWD